MSASMTPQSPRPARRSRRRNPDGPLPPDPALETALVGLVADGTLSDSQARAVRAARSGAAESPPASTGDATARRSPLPEVLGYAGAALLASAAFSLVVDRWDSWPDGVRLGLLVGAVVALWAAGVAVLLLGGGHRALGTPTHANRRRLVGVLLGLSVPLAGLATVQGLSIVLGDLPDGSPWYVVPGLVALVVAAGAAGLVRGVMTTLGVAVGTLWSAEAAAIVLFGPDMRTWMFPVAAAGLGVAWLLVAPRLLAVPPLSEALGMGWLLMGLVPAAMRPVEEFTGGGLPADAVTAAWVARGLLVAMAVACLLLFARGARWPYAAGGVAAGVFAAMSIGGGAFGWIAGMFVAGVVLLGLSAVLVVMRRRATADAPGPAG